MLTFLFKKKHGFVCYSNALGSMLGMVLGLSLDEALGLALGASLSFKGELDASLGVFSPSVCVDCPYAWVYYLTPPRPREWSHEYVGNPINFDRKSPRIRDEA
jgi:hypothetical protein